MLRNLLLMHWIFFSLSNSFFKHVINIAGLACEGIYRISGLKSKLRNLKNQYNLGQKVYLYEHEPHIVASLLKQFLRDLPEPILTANLTPKFEEAAGEHLFWLLIQLEIKKTFLIN